MTERCFFSLHHFVVATLRCAKRQHKKRLYVNEIVQWYIYIFYIHTMKTAHHAHSLVKTKTENAFALIHFGSNAKYFELELYFCMMLRNYTKQNIIYMYSLRDTPAAFVSEIAPFVYETIGFDDDTITVNVDYVSGYSSFNTLRTCDFIFAYTLTQYQKVCIVESDLVIMKRIDDIFKLNTPAILSYQHHKRGNLFTHAINHNRKHARTIDDSQLLKKCEGESGLNGGVMLIEPSEAMFNKYSTAIKEVAKHTCKYPNEALFELINNSYYNLPVKYNLSHYHTLRLDEMGISPSDVVIYHFNETEYKHLDTIKEKWLEKTENDTNPKYRVKKLAIYHFRDTVYNPHHLHVNAILRKLESDKSVATSVVSASLSTHKSKPEDKLEPVDEWVESYSNTHKRPYWYNVKTKETSWEKKPAPKIPLPEKEPDNKNEKESPKKTSPVKKASPKKETSENVTKETQLEYSKVHGIFPVTDVTEKPKTEEPTKNADVWVKAMSSKYNREYWTNTITGKSV